MKLILPIILVAATVGLIGLGLYQTPTANAGTVSIAAGSALLVPRPDTPDRALTLFLDDMQRRNWREALGDVAQVNGVDEQSMMQEWSGANGSLRTFSNLEGFQLSPLHETSDDAQIRARLHWSTPVGPIEQVRDFRLTREGNTWKVVFPTIDLPSTPAQVVPVTYLRWDLVAAFNDSKAAWSLNRHMDARCGQTFEDTLDLYHKYYNDSRPLPFLLIETWNDYEEGTAIEKRNTLTAACRKPATGQERQTSSAR